MTQRHELLSQIIQERVQKCLPSETTTAFLNFIIE